MGGQVTVPGPRWWRCGLSLRALMVLVLVVGGTLGWEVRRLSIRLQALAQVKAAGAGVIFDFQAPQGRPFQAGASPPGPRWLRRLVGDEPFQTERWLILEDAGPKQDEPTAATVEAIAALDRLQMLNIYRAPLTDAQLARLSGLTALKSVALLDTKITPAALPGIVARPQLDSVTLRFDHDVPASAVLPALATNPRLKRLDLVRLDPTRPGELGELAALPDLERLRIHPSPADESCLDPIGRLSNLKSLDLRSTHATDAGLRRLASLGHLDQLLIDGATVTDEGLAVVARWPDLATLYLTGAGTDPSRLGNVTDRGLAHLAATPRLNQVAIFGRRITDDGLAVLSRLPRLQNLELTGVEATEEGLRNLLAARPLRNLLVLRLPGSD